MPSKFKLIFNLLSKFKLWFINEEEKKLIRKSSFIKKKNPTDFSLIQCPQAEEFFKGFTKFIEKEPNSSFGGVCPKLGYINFLGFIFVLPNFVYKIHLFMIRKKWNKIYSYAGVDIFFHSNNLNIIRKIENLWLALKYFINLDSKEKLINHSFDGILCGDLIFDSYIRFARKPTVNISDPTLILYIQDCYNQICYYKNLTSKYKIKNYYSSYSTYIAHGVPVRVFLKSGIRVYTTAYIAEESYGFKVKELSINDTTQSKPHWTYRKIFRSLKNKQELSTIGLKKFKQRFLGKNDLDFMEENQYSSNYSSPIFKDKFDGVVFIGDFFDSQHVFRKIIFSDLYDWLIHTIELTLKNDLNIGFKPHPNQLNGSREIIDEIKKKYPSIKWINSKISNNLIFNSEIKFGVSVYGSVIPELAFHKIKPISCGDNPSSDFNFSFQANNKEEYNSYILGHKNLKFNSDLEQQLGEYYYMNNIYKFNYVEGF